jgi:hypothetical protein
LELIDTLRTSIKHKHRASHQSRIQVNRQEKSVLVDGTPEPLSGTAEALDDTLFFLDELSKIPCGQFISSGDLEKIDSSKAGRRWDRVVKRLPSRLQSIITSSTKKCYAVMAQ